MKYRKLRAPISVQVETTELCNNNCIHCYNHWRDKNDGSYKSLKKEDLFFIIEQLIENQVFSVTFTGGEPLIFDQIFPDAIEKLVFAGVNVSLNSNLILLDSKKASILKQKGLNSVLVSVLSYKEDVHDEIVDSQGAWQKTIKGIKTAIFAGLNVSANMVLLQQNYDQMYETASFLQKIGVKNFSATKASPALNSRNFNNLRVTKEQLKASLELLQKIKKELNMHVDILECYPLCLIGDVGRFRYFSRRSCSAGVTTCTISASGEIRPCSHADMIYGNIFKEKLQEIWDKMSDWREGKYIPEECQSCKFIQRCSGGCRMEAKYYGDIKSKDPYMIAPEEVVFDKQQLQNKPSFDDTKRYILPYKIFYRKEDFGAIVKTSRGETILVNEDGYKILKAIDAQKKNYIKRNT